jgi:glycosyltransferase involved in cell wall biosynthesis
MNRPAFSVIVPAYNAAPTIGDTIRSVLNQTVADFELIVVDDGSTDDTSSAVDGFARDARLRHVRQPNAGPSAARNRGLAAAHARYVSFLDADDLLLPEYLAVMGETLERSGAAFAHCDFWILDDRTGNVSPWPLGQLELPSNPQELLRVLLRRNVVHYAVAARADAVREVGGFNSALKASEDLELWLRLLANGFGAVRAPGRLCVWRDKGGSLSTQATLMASTLCEVYRIVMDEYDVPSDIRELARMRRNAELRHLAALSRERPFAAALARVRRTLGGLPRRRRRAIPQELAAAFPELARSGRSR